MLDQLVFSATAQITEDQYLGAENPSNLNLNASAFLVMRAIRRHSLCITETGAGQGSRKACIDIL